MDVNDADEDHSNDEKRILEFNELFGLCLQLK
jgi:hypothetical protein